MPRRSSLVNLKEASGPLIAPIAGGATWPALNRLQQIIQFPTRCYVFGVLLSASSSITAASTRRTIAVCRGDAALLTLQNSADVLASITFATGAASILDLPVTSNIGVGFESPFLPYFNTGESIWGYCTSNLVAGETLVASATVYYALAAEVEREL